MPIGNVIRKGYKRNARGSGWSVKVVIVQRVMRDVYLSDMVFIRKTVMTCRTFW